MSNRNYWLIFLALVAASVLVSWKFSDPIGLDRFIASGINSFNSQLNTTIDTFKTNATTDRVNTEANTEVSPEIRELPARGMHDLTNRSMCTKPVTREITDVEEYPIYKWVDDKGQTHYSDTKPADAPLSRVDRVANTQLFRFNLERRNVNLPPTYEGYIKAAGTKIYDLYESWLGRDSLKQSQIQLLVFGKNAEFESYREKHAPSLKSSSGFYTHRKNLAVINHSQSIEQTQKTSVHEIAHLITAAHFGAIPAWLTEGISEYFEDIDTTALGTPVRPATRRKSQLRQLQAKGRLANLDHYLSADRNQFYGEEIKQHYLAAWSLVHMLMSTYKGQEVISSLLKEQRDNFCKPFDAKERLYQLYPGGYPNLNRNWASWIRN